MYAKAFLNGINRKSRKGDQEEIVKPSEIKLPDKIVSQQTGKHNEVTTDMSTQQKNYELVLYDKYMF